MNKYTIVLSCIIIISLILSQSSHARPLSRPSQIVSFYTCTSGYQSNITAISTPSPILASFHFIIYLAS